MEKKNNKPLVDINLPGEKAKIIKALMEMNKCHVVFVYPNEGYSCYLSKVPQVFRCVP